MSLSCLRSLMNKTLNPKPNPNPKNAHLKQKQKEAASSVAPDDAAALGPAASFLAGTVTPPIARPTPAPTAPLPTASQREASERLANGKASPAAVPPKVQGMPSIRIDVKASPEQPSIPLPVSPKSHVASGLPKAEV